MVLRVQHHQQLCWKSLSSTVAFLKKCWEARRKSSRRRWSGCPGRWRDYQVAGPDHTQEIQPLGAQRGTRVLSLPRCLTHLLARLGVVWYSPGLREVSLSEEP